MDVVTKELQQLRQRWDLAAQNAGFGVWDLDIRNEQVHYSPQWTAALGYGDSDVPEPTSTWRNRVHPDDLQAMMEALSAHFSGQRPAYEKEFRLRAADGAYRWVLSRGRVVERDAQGDPLRAIGTLTDLTDRRQADGLRAQQERHEAARGASTEVIGRMSHELRTPLNAVLGFSQLLTLCIGSAHPDEQRRYVKHIEDAGWRLLQMVDDLLDLSQLEKGHLNVHVQPVALSTAIRAAVEASEPLARQHGVQLRLGTSQVNAMVRADESRLRQVLVNLLSNGIKYNRAGGSVTVDAYSVADGMWRIDIIDNGIGIGQEQLARLFEPFHRTGSRHSGIEGLGLGLVLCRSLLDMMGGRLDVASVAAVGSTFSVWLAAAEAAVGGPPTRLLSSVDQQQSAQRRR